LEQGSFTRTLYENEKIIISLLLHDKHTAGIPYWKINVVKLPKVVVKAVFDRKGR